MDSDIPVGDRLRRLEDLINQFADEARQIDMQVQYEPVRRKTINLRVRANELRAQVSGLATSCAAAGAVHPAFRALVHRMSVNPPGES